MISGKIYFTHQNLGNINLRKKVKSCYCCLFAPPVHDTYHPVPQKFFKNLTLGNIPVPNSPVALLPNFVRADGMGHILLMSCLI